MSDCVLVDFDGTLISGDSTRYLLTALLGLRPWRLAGCLRHLVSFIRAADEQAVQAAKNRMIGHCIQGLTRTQMAPALLRFSRKVRPLRRPVVVQAVERGVADDGCVLIVTASPDFAVQTALSDLKVDVIGTRFVLEGDRYTGQLLGPGCYGSHKPKHIAEWAESHGVTLDFVEAWSDAASDFPMMQLAPMRYWVCAPSQVERIQQLDPDGLIVPGGVAMR